MKLWMDVMCDLEHVMNDHERIFDAWTEGVWMAWSPAFFNTAQLRPGAKGPSSIAYDPNPSVYPWPPSTIRSASCPGSTLVVSRRRPDVRQGPQAVVAGG